MSSPNYAALLQALWTPTITTTLDPEQPKFEVSDDGDIFQFLGNQLLWQETIAAQAGIEPT